MKTVGWDECEFFGKKRFILPVIGELSLNSIFLFVVDLLYNKL